MGLKGMGHLGVPLGARPKSEGKNFTGEYVKQTILNSLHTEMYFETYFVASGKFKNTI